MNVFQTHSRIINDYATYIRSFLNIADPKIKEHVEEELSTQSKDFVVTSGTGSGKSLTYIGSIFHYLLSNPKQQGIVAIVVYPINALINSQFEGFDRYKKNYEKAAGKDFPITFGQYTGQEKEEKREQMRENPPHILLTNDMMLELLLTRMRERSLRDAIYKNLRFLVFDELHTYRGRQGADVAMLIRRIRAKCLQDVISIGTSATMVSTGDSATQRNEVAKHGETVLNFLTLASHYNFSRVLCHS